jgi:bifunctional DNA-binding transcriptional regulator/antitoxin component of YhaV-PrlF toxin-antitoxin module
MVIARADAKKRVVIPGARPGDVFEVDSAGEGRYTLVRLERKLDRPRLSRDEAVRSIADYPLTPGLRWDELREMTREP